MMTPLVLAFALALQAQYVPPPPYTPYVQPSPYAPQAYPSRGYYPPTLPPGSPSLMIPNPPYAPPPYQPWTGARP